MEGSGSLTLQHVHIQEVHTNYKQLHTNKLTKQRLVRVGGVTVGVTS